ncbi:MAG: aminopeptidase P N-terminal domain-containing protein [Planctomycetota bacterium]
MTSPIHAAARAAFLAQLKELGAAAVIPTATHKIRNDDSHYAFRPTSDFWYLTGFDEPDACLVLLPAEDRGRPARSILFLRERDKEREIWDGRRLGVERAPKTLGIDEARDVGKLWSDLPTLLAGIERIVWRLGDDAERDRRMTETFSLLRARARGPVAPPVALVDPGPTLHELRVRKSAAELEHMRRAAQLTADAHRDLMAFVEPGRNERETQAFLDHRYRSEGSTGAAYGHICAGGANACILHYVENDMELIDGDLILVDSGAEWNYYAGDVTRTFPVNGRFTDDQRALYRVVLDAELAAIAAVKPGATFDEVHTAALHVIVDGLIQLGILDGERDALIADGAHRRFFMHKTSHYLGLDVHDQGSYFTGGRPRPLEPGMVLTVEPGIYVDPEDEEVEARWRGIGIRIEDDVLVTEDGHEVLTGSAPKEPEEVEEACRGAVPVP